MSGSTGHRKARWCAIGSDEIGYLLGILDPHSKTELGPDDLVWSCSGVRPHFDDDEGRGGSTLPRDYMFELDGGGDRAPILSAFGGNLTTYRRRSEATLA